MLVGCRAGLGVVSFPVTDWLAAARARGGRVLTVACHTQKFIHTFNSVTGQALWISVRRSAFFVFLFRNCYSKIVDSFLLSKISLIKKIQFFKGVLECILKEQRTRTETPPRGFEEEIIPY